MLKSVLLSVLFASSCFLQKKEEEDTDILLYAALGIAFYSNPCNWIASPVQLSAQSSSSLPANYASVKGKLVTSAGRPVVNALVVLDETNSLTDSYYYGSHAAVIRDGSFVISGFSLRGRFPCRVTAISSVDRAYSFLPVQQN